jgi:hypothetical protein
MKTADKLSLPAAITFEKFMTLPKVRLDLRLYLPFA